MREGRRLVLGFLMLLWVAGAGLAKEVPVAVSPGSATGTVIGDACPVFSWTAVAHATTYEVAVYTIEEGASESSVVIQESIPGGALAWTPSLDRCLERGGQYAWSVRAPLRGSVTCPKESLNLADSSI